MSQQSDDLKEKVQTVLEFFEKNLVKRSEWGAVTFEKAEDDLNKAKSLLSYFNILPLEYLPEATAPQISQKVDALSTVLEKIDSFSITAGSPTPERDTLSSQLHTHVQALYTTSATWIPFLAYQKGDVTENINKLSASVTQANTILTTTKDEIENKKNEVDEIIKAAREASASAGAAVFTEDFENEAGNNKSEASDWMKYTLISVGVTFLVAILFWGLSYVTVLIPTDKYQAIQIIMAKLVILSLLVSACFWCARNYKIQMHLSKGHKHRALSLKTLQAFFKSASDDQAKDAVLLEVTRSVFGNTSTGYLGGTGDTQHPIMTVMEMTKKISSQPEP